MAIKMMAVIPVAAMIVCFLISVGCSFYALSLYRHGSGKRIDVEVYRYFFGQLWSEAPLVFIGWLGGILLGLLLLMISIFFL